MIEFRTGDLIAADAEALVNAVNTVGVMGKGIALRFKEAYPENSGAYADACQKAEVEIGKMLTVALGGSRNPRYVINFPTKKHWRGKSRLEYVRVGSEALVGEIEKSDIRSIAVPALGCGNGGLDWDEVRPLTKLAFATVPDVRVLIYEPGDTPLKRRNT